MSKALSASLGVPSSSGTYSAALEGLTKVNEVLLRRDPSIPPLYSTGARWELRPDDESDTRWRYADEVATDGWGDCQALAAYRAAELRVNGIDPRAEVRVYPTGENKYHAVVARGNGLVEDPSVALGMLPFPGGPMTTDKLPAIQGHGGAMSQHAIVGAKRQIARSVAGLHPHAAIVGIGVLGDETGKSPKVARVKDAAPEFARPTFHVVGHACGSVRGWKGVHRVPLKDGSAIVGMTRTYNNPADCVGDAIGLISDIASSIAKSPVAAMLLSPFSAGTTMALMDPGVQQALGSVGRAVKSGVKAGGTSPSSSDSGWPMEWSVSGGTLNKRQAAVVGWGVGAINRVLMSPGAISPRASQLDVMGATATSRPTGGTTPTSGFRPTPGGSATNPGATNPGGGGIVPAGSTILNRNLNSGGAGGSSQTYSAQFPYYNPATGLYQSTPPATTTNPYYYPPSSPTYTPQTPYYNQQTGQYQSTMPPGYNSWGSTPSTPPGYAPGYNPYTPAFNTTTGQYQSAYQQYNPYAYNAPTASDFGLPFIPSGEGVPSEASNLQAIYSDPASMNAYATYYDPVSTGYWNTPNMGYMPLPGNY